MTIFEQIMYLKKALKNSEKNQKCSKMETFLRQRNVESRELHVDTDVKKTYGMGL